MEIGINQKGETNFWKKLTLSLVSKTQYFLFNVQVLWSYDCKSG